MTIKKAIVAGIGLTLLNACTTLEERQRANGEYVYLGEAEAKHFVVPEGLDAPEFSSDYELPALGSDADASLLGDKLTIHSPALVLPLVTGSHIEDGLKEATVWFDQVDDSQALDTTIWNSLISYLEEQGIGVVSFDKDNQTLITDWMIIETSEDNEGWFDWTTTERSVGRRFEFNLDMKPHGRTAALKANMRDYLETVGDEVIADIDFEQQRRNEVDVLNQVISHYQHQIRVADVKRIQRIRSGLPMELGFDKDGEPAFVVKGEYDIVWPRFLLVLRKLGFNVKDFDKSNGLLFVTFGSEDEGWWSNLFSSDDDELDLEKDEYRFMVLPAGNNTSITLMDNENNVFPVNKVTELFASFERTMSADNLDI